MGFLTDVFVSAIQDALQKGDPKKMAESAFHILKRQDMKRLSVVALRMILRHIAEERAPTRTLERDDWMNVPSSQLSRVQMTLIQRLTPETTVATIDEDARGLTLRLIACEHRAQQQLEACFVALLVSYRAMR